MDEINQTARTLFTVQTMAATIACLTCPCSVLAANTGLYKEGRSGRSILRINASNWLRQHCVGRIRFELIPLWANSCNMQCEIQTESTEIKDRKRKSMPSIQLATRMYCVIIQKYSQ